MWIRGLEVRPHGGALLLLPLPPRFPPPPVPPPPFPAVVVGAI